MRRFFLSLAVLTGLLAASQALAVPAIVSGGAGTAGTAIVVSSDAVGMSTFTSGPSTVSIPSGSLVVASGQNRSGNAPSCSDSVNGAYTAAASFAYASNAGTAAWYIITPVTLPIGTTWSCYFGDSNTHSIGVMAFSGVSAFDAGAANSGGTAAGAISLASVASSAAGDLIVYGASFDNGNVFQTEDANYTTVTQTTALQAVHMAYRIAGAAGSYTPAPSTNATGYNFASNVASFKASTVVASCKHTLSTLGVGC